VVRASTVRRSGCPGRKWVWNAYNTSPPFPTVQRARRVANAGAVTAASASLEQRQQRHVRAGQAILVSRHLRLVVTRRPIPASCSCAPGESAGPGRACDSARCPRWPTISAWGRCPDGAPGSRRDRRVTTSICAGGYFAEGANRIPRRPAAAAGDRVPGLPAPGRGQWDSVGSYLELTDRLGRSAHWRPCTGSLAPACQARRALGHQAIHARPRAPGHPAPTPE
jgi:hypothetical protein